MPPSISLQLGDTALTTASYDGNFRLVRMLLEAGATVNTITKVMAFPIHRAKQNSRKHGTL